MATSSIANLFSFFTPSKPPPPPPTPAVKFPPLHLSTAASSSLAATHPGWSPLVLSNEAQSSPSCSSDVMSVVCPSLASANIMFFRSAYNVQVIVDDHEPEERLIGRFRREVMRAGVIQESKRRRYFENKQDEKKRKTREAAKRNRRRRPFVRPPGPQDRQEAAKMRKEEDDGDNWDLPKGDIPY